MSYPLLLSIDYLQFNYLYNPSITVPDRDFHLGDFIFEFVSQKRFRMKTTHNIHYRQKNTTVKVGEFGVYSDKSTGYSFKVDNRLLYSRGDYHYVMKFVQSLGLVQRSITRLDFAVDTNKRMRHFIRKVLEGQLVGNSRISRKHQAIFDSKLNCETFTLTEFKKDTKRTWCIYNKTNQLQDMNDKLFKKGETMTYKPYIKTAWNHAGLNTSNDVWRIELRARRSFFKEKAMLIDDKIVPIDLINPLALSYKDTLSLFSIVEDKLLDYRFDDATEFTNCTKLQLIDERLISRVPNYRIHYEEQKRITMTESKQMIKLLDKFKKQLIDDFGGGTNLLVIDKMRELAKSYDASLSTYSDDLASNPSDYFNQIAEKVQDVTIVNRTDITVKKMAFADFEEEVEKADFKSHMNIQQRVKAKQKKRGTAALHVD